MFRIKRVDEVQSEIQLIYQKEDKIPEYYKKEMSVNNYGTKINDNVIGILLTNLRDKEQISHFDIADELLNKGVPLPQPRRARKDFNTKAEYLDHLIHSPRDLYIKLHQNPLFVNVKDENGQTLLHHAAKKCYKLRLDGAKLILYLLFRVQGLNFKIKDNAGRTPLFYALANYKPGQSSIHVGNEIYHMFNERAGINPFYKVNENSSQCRIL